MEQYIRKNDYEAVQLDGEWIVLNTDKFTVTKLNELGGFCWSLLGEAQSLESLVQAIVSRYACDSDTAHQDLEAFLSELLRYELVEYAS